MLIVEEIVEARRGGERGKARFSLGWGCTYQYLQNGSIWLYGTTTPQNDTRVTIINGFTSDAKTALGEYAAMACPTAV